MVLTFNRFFLVVASLLVFSQAQGQTISYTVPHDINPNSGTTIDELSLAFMRFSFETFAALNWPAQINSAGDPIPVPNTSVSLDYQDGEYPTVWEAWFEARDLFLPNGATPAQWASPHVFPSACATLATTQVKPKIMLASVSKGGEVLDEFVQAFRMGPVIDANGEFVRYGINFNQTMYDYITDNMLYNKMGQVLFSKDNPQGADFPKGVYGGEEVGAIMVKSSWKILGDGDNPEDFHRISAWIYNPPQPDAKEKCREGLVGLTGFHITHRTQSAPQWVWATFEHVDNAPDWEAATGLKPWKDSYSFFDPDKCPVVDHKPSCDYNTLPTRPWDPEIPGQAQTQVIRTGSISPLAAQVNDEFQIALAGTVWENYMIINAQWPTRLGSSGGIPVINPAYPYGSPEPTFLANSTMETFIQGFVPSDSTTDGFPVPGQDASYFLIGTTSGAPRNSSSCVNCHGDSSMTTGVPGNFVYSLNRAQDQMMAINRRIILKSLPTTLLAPPAIAQTDHPKCRQGLRYRLRLLP